GRRSDPALWLFSIKPRAFETRDDIAIVRDWAVAALALSSLRPCSPTNLASTSSGSCWRRSQRRGKTGSCNRDYAACAIADSHGEVAAKIQAHVVVAVVQVLEYSVPARRDIPLLPAIASRT